MIDLPTSDPSAHGMDAGRLERAHALIDTHIAEGQAPTIAAVVTRHGEIVFEHYAGDARPDGQQLDGSWLWALNSLTKPMTSCVVLMLVEEGKIALTSRAVDYAPRLAEGGNENVLVSHLLTHTSGIADEDLRARRDERLAARDLGDVPEDLDLLSHILLNLGWDVAARHEPGDVMKYSTFNYSVLGEIVRRVTGQSFADVLRERLLEPLGMHDTVMVVTDDVLERVVERPQGLPLTDGHPDSAMDMRNPLFLACDDASLGAHSTPRDLARFNQFILDDGCVGDQRLLSPASMRGLTTNRLPGIPAELLVMRKPEASWSYGFSVSDTTAWWKYGAATSTPGTLRHGGNGGMWNWIDRNTGVGGVYFEMISEIDDDGMPPLWAANRFEELVTASVTS